MGTGGSRRRMRTRSGRGCGQVMRRSRRLVRWGCRPVGCGRIWCGVAGSGPLPRRRSPGRLSLAEREEISRGLAAGLSLRVIAAGLGRAPSTVSREVAAQWRPWQVSGRSGRPAGVGAGQASAGVQAGNPPALRAIVAEKLKQQQWSPQQIAGWLKTTYPDDPEMQVSHETIYRTLFIQSRGALRKELTAHLRTGRVIRRPAGTRLPGWSWWPAGDPQHLRTPRRGRRPRSARALGG